MILKYFVLCLASYTFDSTDNKTQWVNLCSNMNSVVSHSLANNLEEESLIALMWHETRWRNRLVSSVGACGMAQVIPRYTVPRVSCRQLKNPDTGIEYGAIALRNWMNASDNNLTRAYCHYNSGNNCYERGLNYARRVKRSYRRLKRIVRQTNQRINSTIIQNNIKDFVSIWF